MRTAFTNAEYAMSISFMGTAVGIAAPQSWNTSGNFQSKDMNK
jgi:hypothetical protein